MKEASGFYCWQYVRYKDCDKEGEREKERVLKNEKTFINYDFQNSIYMFSGPQL